VTSGIPARADRPVRQAFQVLHWGFVALLIVVGADKFFGYLASWAQYLAPMVSDLLGIAPREIMYGVGVIELGAALLVALRPSVGGWLVAAWLWAIIGNLLVGAGHYDIALRDLGLSLAAIALARLAVGFEDSPLRD
jgi:hypothetical protein